MSCTVTSGRAPSGGALASYLPGLLAKIKVLGVLPAH